MPNWGDISKKLATANEAYFSAQMRKDYINLLEQYTGRNVITYYSAFMQRPGINGCSIDDNDKNAFMQMIALIPKDKRKRGLDLVLHTPGGDIAATESLVYYLKSIFGNDIRAIVPQMAMSAGTMIALATKEIIMGKQSNLGPIDPQYGGISCSGVVEEFFNALDSVKKEPSSAIIWANIIGKYHPTFVGDCEKAIELSKKIVSEWLSDNMFGDEPDEEKHKKIEKIINFLSSHETTFTHSRHIHMDVLQSLNVKVTALESYGPKELGDCSDFQDCVLTLHHIYMATISKTTALKIIENGYGGMIFQPSAN
ncbi:SDH family Clp fold serine proteinase [Dialister hominis]|uniref:SDH family Clp fold serine proteinase n=1 Tax=Dialister hominis TaxID=2582419 RepID=UPI003AF0CCF9